MLAALFPFRILVFLFLGHCVVEMVELVNDGGLELIVTLEELSILAFQILISL